MTLSPGSAAYLARIEARSGALSGPTANLAPGLVQANLAILLREFAYDFLLFCQRNPKPYPLVGVSDAGMPMIEAPGHDLVTLATGCSFSFEEALLASNVPVRHIEDGTNVNRVMKEEGTDDR
jgi:uncharacterized protein YcsI (UPF0317 family)